MKWFLFIITLFSIGRFIDTAAEDDADSNFSGTDEVQTKDIRSEQTTYDEKKSDENASEDESSEQKRHDKKKERGPPVDYQRLQILRDETKRFIDDLERGDSADLINENQHVQQSNYYIDLGRRSVAQDLKNIAAENADYLTPEKAPPELVLLVAKESAMLRAGKDTDQGSDFDQKKILRSGDYWNGVWKEEVKPKSAMRSSAQKKLGSIKAKINPGTELYKAVSRMKKISPQLLYIINKKLP